jgi:hypothetical protein
LVALSSLPLATCWATVDNGNAALQLPDLPSVTPVQVAVTADAGTVEQLANDEEVACTVKVQV